MGQNFRQITVIAIPILIAAALIAGNELVSRSKRAGVEVRVPGTYIMPTAPGEPVPQALAKQLEQVETTQPMAVLFVGLCYQSSDKIIELYLPALRASKNTLIVADLGAERETLDHLQDAFGTHTKVVIDEDRELTKGVGVTFTPLFLIVDQNEVLYVGDPTELPDIGGIQAILYKDNFKS